VIPYIALDYVKQTVAPVPQVVKVVVALRYKFEIGLIVHVVGTARVEVNALYVYVPEVDNTLE